MTTTTRSTRARRPGGVRRRRTVLAAVVALTGLAGAAQLARADAPATGVTLDASTYEVVNVASGRVLDMRDRSTADGGQLQQWSWADTDNQKWRFTRQDDGTYSITNVHSGKVLDVAGWATTDGAQVVQYSWLNGDNQKFTVSDAGDGSYLLTAKHSGKVLDVAGASRDDGAVVHQWTEHGGTNERFKLVPLDGGGGGGSTPSPTPSPTPSTTPTTPAPSPSGTGGSGGGTGAGEPAKPASTWRNTIGIGTRFDWKVKDGRFGAARAALQSLGVEHVRTGLGGEGVDWNDYVAQLSKAATDLGLEYALTVSGESPDSIRQMTDGWTKTPGVVYALEGANETFDRQAWWDGAYQNSLDLQKTIKQVADDHGLQSYTWSQGGPIKPYLDWPNGAPWATHANFHAYPWDTSYAGGYFQRKTIPLFQDGSVAEGSVPTVKKWAGDPDKKLAMTEWGYSYGDDGVGPVRDETARAKLIARNAFEIINAGIDKSYYYSLMDEDNRFGIANADGSLRTSGTLLANVFTLLRDGGKATPGALDYSMSTASGMPVVDDHEIGTDEVHHTLLHSSDGSFWLALWVDDDPQDGENGTQQVTLDLKTPVTSVTPYTPLDGLTAGTALTGQEVTVTVPDHPLLLKIQPKG